MNDEIKEKKTKRIIEKIEGLATYVTIPRELAIYNVNIDSQEAKLLLDYITNLQQENEKLKVKYNEEKSHQINYNYFETLYSKSTKEIVIDDLVWKCEELDNFKKEYEKLYIEKEDYKSRCKKADEKIKKHLYDKKFLNNTHTSEQILNIVSNVLNGDNNE
jgi:hypothetical protein